MIDRSAEIFIGLCTRVQGKLSIKTPRPVMLEQAEFYNESKEVMRFEVVKGSK